MLLGVVQNSMQLETMIFDFDITEDDMRLIFPIFLFCLLNANGVSLFLIRKVRPFSVKIA